MTEQLWEPTEWLTLGISEQVDMYLATLEERDLLAVWDVEDMKDKDEAGEEEENGTAD